MPIGVGVTPSDWPSNSQSGPPGMRIFTPARSEGPLTSRTLRRFTWRVPRYVGARITIPIFGATTSASSTAPMNRFISPPPEKGLCGLELRHGYGKPLHAVRAEVDLHARIAPVPFGVDDDALAELGVHHVLPDAEATDVARRATRRNAGTRLPAEVRRERLLAREARRQPLHKALRDFLEKARWDVVARLPMQHARLRVREIQALACPSDRDVGKPALLLEAVALHHALLVREKALFQAGHEDDVELEALRRMHGHHLQRIGAFARLVFARLERRVGQERGERVGRLAGFDFALLLAEGSRGVDQLFEVGDAVGAFALGLVMLDQPALRDDVLDDLFQRQALRRGAQR